MSDEEKEQIRRPAIIKAKQEAKKTGLDWNCFPVPEQEARMLTELHRIEGIFSH
jgi:hypothetical protein